MLDTIAANRGGCALGRVCKRESQTLARRSDLHAVQARPGFHEIMPRCLIVCVCVCVHVCVRVCVCVCELAHTYQPPAIRLVYYPTRHQVGVRQRVMWALGALLAAATAFAVHAERRALGGMGSALTQAGALCTERWEGWSQHSRKRVRHPLQPNHLAGTRAAAAKASQVGCRTTSQGSALVHCSARGAGRHGWQEFHT